MVEASALELMAIVANKVTEAVGREQGETEACLVTSIRQQRRRRHWWLLRLFHTTLHFIVNVNGKLTELGIQEPAPFLMGLGGAGLIR